MSEEQETGKESQDEDKQNASVDEAKDAAPVAEEKPAADAAANPAEVKSEEKEKVPEAATEEKKEPVADAKTEPEKTTPVTEVKKDEKNAENDAPEKNDDENKKIEEKKGDTKNEEKKDENKKKDDLTNDDKKEVAKEVINEPSVAAPSPETKVNENEKPKENDGKPNEKKEETEEKKEEIKKDEKVEKTTENKPKEDAPKKEEKEKTKIEKKKTEEKIEQKKEEKPQVEVKNILGGLKSNIIKTSDNVDQLVTKSVSEKEKEEAKIMEILSGKDEDDKQKEEAKKDEPKKEEVKKENQDMETIAATKIQAMYKGHQQREEFKKMKKKIGKEESKKVKKEEEGEKKTKSLPNRKSIAAAQTLRAQGNQALYMHKNAHIISAFYGPTNNPNHTNVTQRIQQLHKQNKFIDLPNINEFFKFPFPKSETLLTIYFQNMVSSNSSSVSANKKQKQIQSKNISSSKKIKNENNNKSKISVPPSTHRLQPDEKLLAEMENKTMTVQTETDEMFHKILSNEKMSINLDSVKSKAIALEKNNSKLMSELSKTTKLLDACKQELALCQENLTNTQIINEKYAKERELCNHHVKMKTEQVQSLKKSIENLKTSLEEILAEKSNLEIKNKDYVKNFKELESEMENTQQLYNESLQDLKRLPEFKNLEIEIKNLNLALEEEQNMHYRTRKENEQREDEMLHDQQALKDKCVSLEMDMNSWKQERDELEKLIRGRDVEFNELGMKYKQLEETHVQQAEQMTQLRIKLGLIESETKAEVELEKMKGKIMLESLNNELKWREKLFKTKNQILQKQLNTCCLEKLKIQKSLTQLEAMVQEEREEELLHQQRSAAAAAHAAHHQQQQQHNQPPPIPPFGQPPPIGPRSNRRIMMKQKISDMEALDNEIARLKHNLELNPYSEGIETPIGHHGQIGEIEGNNTTSGLTLPPIHHNRITGGANNNLQGDELHKQFQQFQIQKEIEDQVQRQLNYFRAQQHPNLNEEAALSPRSTKDAPRHHSQAGGYGSMHHQQSNHHHSSNNRRMKKNSSMSSAYEIKQNKRSSMIPSTNKKKKFKRNVEESKGGWR